MKIHLKRYIEILILIVMCSGQLKHYMIKLEKWGERILKVIRKN